MQAVIEQYKATIRAAAAHETPLQICGGGTKHFYGNSINWQSDTSLDSTVYRGIIEYEPTELIITCLLYTSPSPRDGLLSRMPSSA